MSRNMAIEGYHGSVLDAIVDTWRFLFSAMAGGSLPFWQIGVAYRF
jgi:hypothetical protein